MKILTDPKKIVGVVEAEPDDTTYVGHFTVEGMIQFVEDLEKKYQHHQLISIKRVFSGDMYILLAVADDGPGSANREHIALAGCAHGKDGLE